MLRELEGVFFVTVSALDTGTAWSRSMVKPVVLSMFKDVCGSNLLNNK
jgi:hypothetical protein